MQANRARELAKALDRQEPSAAAEEGGKKKRKRGGKKEAPASKTAPVFTARALDPLVLPRERNPIQRRSVDAPLSEELAGAWLPCTYKGTGVMSTQGGLGSEGQGGSGDLWLAPRLDCRVLLLRA